jgi:hypothetical protein
MSDAILYGEILYGEDLYSGPGASASWTKAETLSDYVRGATVLVTVTPTWTVPTGTTVTILAGQTIEELEEVTPFVETPVFFEQDSGPVNIQLRLLFHSNLYGESAIVDTLTIDVRQQTSLYTVADQVLNDALQLTGTPYMIDPWLQNVLLDYGWINPVKHRFAIARVAEASGGVVYADRNGVVRLESALFQNGNTIVDTINKNRLFDVQNVSSDVSNIIRITTKPYVELPIETVWTLSGDNLINSGQRRSFQVFFSDYDAVLEPAAVLSSSPAGATIESELWYTWGGTIVVEGSSNGQELTLSVEGKPLVVRGSRVVEAVDTQSIFRNGEHVLAIETNTLIQDATIAQVISNTLLSKRKDERRDIEINWRGDPTIELTDRVSVVGLNYEVQEQEITFNGALQAKARLTKV